MFTVVTPIMVTRVRCIFAPCATCLVTFVAKYLPDYISIYVSASLNDFFAFKVVPPNLNHIRKLERA